MPCVVQRREEGTALPEVVFVSAPQQIQIFGRKRAFIWIVIRILQEASGVVDLFIFLHKCEIRLEFSVGK